MKSKHTENSHRRLDNEVRWREEGVPPPNSSEDIFPVAGMDCSEEVAAIERSLKPLSGVLGVRADIVSSKVTVLHDGTIARAAMARAIREAGVTIREEGAVSGTPNLSIALVAVSGIATGFGLIMPWAGFENRWLPAISYILAILAGGCLILPKAWRSLRSWSLDMNVLMTVAVLGAVAIGEHAEGAAVVFLFALSELLESWSVGRARRAIASLMQLAPDTALVKRQGEFVTVEAAAVRSGETILVKSGQRVPLDGEIVSGASSLDQSAITGESIPVEKTSGDTVFAGTINGEGSLEIRVSKAASESTLARIIKLVEEAQRQKAPAQRFVDTFAKYYTPAVMILATLLAVVPPLFLGHASGIWIYRALVLLVIACPCALVISTPVSIVSGLTAMARRGVLIKGGVHLEALGGLRALAVDKTGTITEGKPRVQKIICIGATVETDILRIAASIDIHSTHPLAQAVVRYAEGRGICTGEVTEYRSHTGRGAEAILDGHRYFVGNHRFAHERGVCSPDLERRLAEMESLAQSVIVVGHSPHDDCAGETLGILTVSDAIRPGAVEAVKRIHHAGVCKIVMLSGDNQRTAAAIAAQVGIDDASGDLLPEQKIERVRELCARYGSVGMIGDGVNDAPALAAATVGIAMGAAGTDTAIETADVALMRDDLLSVSEAIHLGRRTLHMIQFNIIFALAVKAFFLVLALLGQTSLWMAVMADTGATLLVVANALRLLRTPSP